LPAIFPFLSQRIIQLTKEEFLDLLKLQSMLIISFGSKTKQVLSKAGEYQFCSQMISMYRPFIW